MHIVTIILAIALFILILLRFKESGEKTKTQDKVTVSKEKEKAEEPKPVKESASSTEPLENRTAQVIEIQSIAQDDLMSEAIIYMQYGHFSQAATVLRWLIDMQPNNTKAVNMLLDAYMSIPDLDEYTALLSYLGMQNVESKENIKIHWETRIVEGLRKDPGNLELLALAETLKIKVPDPDSNENSGISSSKALALIARNSSLGYAKPLLQGAIRNEPMKLALYAELLRIEHKHKDVIGFVETLVLMMLIMRGTHSMKSISERMISSGRVLAPDNVIWDELSRAMDNHDLLLSIARRLQSPFIQSMHIEGL